MSRALATHRTTATHRSSATHRVAATNRSSISAGSAQVVAGVTTLASVMTDTSTYPDGSTVTITGTFRERVDFSNNGSPRTLTLRALPAHSAIITAGDTAITSGWSAVGSGVYSKAVAYTVKGCTLDGRPLFLFSSLSNLTNAKFSDGTTAGPEEGYYTNGTTLYIKPADLQNPNGRSVVPTRSTVTTGANATGITVANGSNLTLEDVILDQWTARGIYVGEVASGVAARLTCNRVWFRNCYTGVQDGQTSDIESNHITLTNCEFNMSGPIADPYQQWNGPWNIRKTLGASAQGQSDDTPPGIYASNLGARGTFLTCDDLKITSCYWHDTFDCVANKGRFTTSDYGLANKTSYVRYNVMHRYCDNATEIEPGLRYTYMDIDHNFMLDGYTSLATAPFMRGQIDEYNNIIYISEDWYADSGGTTAAVFKVSSTSAYPGADGQPGSPALFDDLAIQRNIRIYNNTFWMGDTPTQWARPVTADEEFWTHTGCEYRNNITIHYKSRLWELGGFILSQYNNMYPGTASTNFKLTQHYLAVSAGGAASFWSTNYPSYDMRPTTILSVDPVFGNVNSSTMFKLQVTSPMRAAGSTAGGIGTSTDLGAIPYGSEWTMPTCGIGAAAAAYRPQLPATLTGAAATYWMGL